MPDIMPFHGIGWLATGEVEVVSQQTPDGKLVDGTGWISEESDFYGRPTKLVFTRALPDFNIQAARG